MPKLVPHDIRFFATPAEMRDWFDANHETADELWLGQYKKASGRPTVSWSDAVDEALCVGWIDGQLQRIDEISHAQRFTPRRKGSNWSAINVAKVGVLTDQGRMRPAGIRAFEARTDARTAVYSYERPIADADRRRGGPAARRPGRLGRLAGAAAVVPSGRHPLDHECEAGGHPGAPAVDADRRLARRAPGQAAGLAAEEAVMPAADPVDVVLADALDRLRVLELGDTFDPRAAASIVETGLHRLVVPAEAGGLGARMSAAAEVLASIGAIDGATALGFAMQVHVVGALVDSDAVPAGLRERLFRAIVDWGALVNNAATEEGGGSPARGAIPGATALPQKDGTWRLTGEKTWTTWLPNLTHAFVTARIEGTDPVEVGSWLLDLDTEGVERRPGFEAMGMRGSASGRLVLHDVPVSGDALLVRRPAAGPDPRGPAPGAWFGVALAATYLGVGEGARADVVRWARDRKPGDGSTAVAAIPTVQLRLGRLDAELRAARLVVLDVARRWDAAVDANDPAGRASAAADVPLAKLVATRAAVAATDEALRIAGGPGFLAGRLERAFRDARAGLINPPLEDVALTGFGRALAETEQA